MHSKVRNPIPQNASLTSNPEPLFDPCESHCESRASDEARVYSWPLSPSHFDWLLFLVLCGSATISGLVLYGIGRLLLVVLQ